MKIDWDKTCGKCKFFDGFFREDSSGGGTCRRYPEGKEIKDDRHWCGEFKAKTGEENENLEIKIRKQ